MKDIPYATDPTLMKSQIPPIRTFELKDECGINNLPNQIMAKAISDGFVFNILCVGETACGKSSLLDSLFNTRLDSTPSTHDNTRVFLRKNTYDLFEREIRLKLTVVETAGFGDQINKDDSFKIIGDFIDEQFQYYLDEELKIKRNLSNYHDTRIHVCLYFINPTGHSLKALDILTMKHLDNKVNILPIIAKSDTISKNELQRFKQNILNELNTAGIKIYRFPTDDETLAEENSKTNNLLPLAIIGSNETVKVGNQYVRARQYPWGVVQVENENHCDFKKLRDSLIEKNMLDLIETTHSKHYEIFRRNRLTELGLTDSVDGKQVSISDTIYMKRNELRQDLDKREQQLKETFMQKVKDKEVELKEIEKQINEQLTNIKKQYKDQKDKCDEKWHILEQEMNLFEQHKRSNMETMKKNTKKK
ncbi:unnamed protein product [Adineta steineri]|uniref:Septin n=2 Tax=Adineta steineri TaxID=433720 RepID=A0A818H9G6_9BILA|nr:unnamed protein product [Adineta steineri]CAF1004697.1 unnamed protein product [Adineta steineri]CAF1076128.1 unnamed protein product [Adineta steineri]CAF3504772.1 unnamed protein product [Adineta steineri]CAF4191923.1 unnamed protein product [Adineta steineri]